MGEDWTKSLKSKHVVVVGGSSGIGKAVAKASLVGGASVTLLARTEARLSAAAVELSGLGKVEYKALDMTDEQATETWFGNRSPGSIDHLVISASDTEHGSFAEAPLSSVRSTFESKFMGPYTVAKAALPTLANGGSITFFSGVLSRRPGINCAALGAVNSAVEGLVRALAVELGPSVRVNCCSPGMVRTEAYDHLSEERRAAMYKSTGESLPLARVGIPDEIAAAVVLMMINTYLTGAVMDIDGGHMVRQFAKR